MKLPATTVQQFSVANSKSNRQRTSGKKRDSGDARHRKSKITPLEGTDQITPNKSFEQRTKCCVV